MRTIFIIILTLFSVKRTDAKTNLEDIDSIAVIVRSESLDSLSLNRINFVPTCAEHNMHRVPIFLFKDKDEIARIVTLISSDSICKNLEYDTGLDVLRLQKTPTGDYDLNRGFFQEDKMNIYALISIFQHGAIRLVWIGKNEIDIGTGRYFNKDIYEHLVVLIPELADDTQYR